MSTHRYQLIATGLLLEFKLANCQQWGRNYSDTMIGFPIAFSVLPIILGCHWGTNADVNVITKNDLGESEKYNIYFYHSNYDGAVLVNWIAIGL